MTTPEISNIFLPKLYSEGIPRLENNLTHLKSQIKRIKVIAAALIITIGLILFATIWPNPSVPLCSAFSLKSICKFKSEREALIKTQITDLNNRKNNYLKLKSLETELSQKISRSNYTSNQAMHNCKFKILENLSHVFPTASSEDKKAILEEAKKIHLEARALPLPVTLKISQTKRIYELFHAMQVA